MADFAARRDMAAVVAFTDALAVFEFEFEADAQVIINESNAVMELSWDGQNVHATLVNNQPSSVISYADHVRKKLWIRRVAGGGGAKFVQVIASTR
jgi:hypothetical protein